MPVKQNNSIINALTIDLEDYYQVSGFESVVKRVDWHTFESRLERNTCRLLDILDSSSHRGPVKATFFVLAWNAERQPSLIRQIDQRGHEIACHGYDHRLVYNMSPDEFRIDIRKSKSILEDLIGKDVIGYRAASYSITRDSLWALKILTEEGYKYDSSIFPIYHDRYGIPEAPRFPFLVDTTSDPRPKFISLDRKPDTLSQEIIEIPLTTLRIWSQNLPVAGGGYFRLLPYGFMKIALARVNMLEKKPFVFYMHPWEIDADQNRISGATWKSQLRHRINLHATEEKFIRLLKEFSFASIWALLREGHITTKIL